MKEEIKHIDPEQLSLIVYEIEISNEMLLDLYEEVKTHEISKLNIGDTQKSIIESVTESFGRELEELDRFIRNIFLISNLKIFRSFYYGFLASAKFMENLNWAIDKLNKNISMPSSTSIQRIYNRILVACRIFRDKVIDEELQLIRV